MVSAAKPSCRPRPRSSVSVSSFHATNKRGGHAQVHRARGSRRAGTGVKALGWSDSGTRSVKKRVADKSVMRDEKEEEESGGSDSEVQGDDAAESHADYVAVVNCNPKEGAADRDGEYSQQLRRLWCDLLDC